MNNSRDKLHNTSLQLISINHLHNFHGSMNKYAAIIFLFLVIFQGLVNCIFLIYVFPPRKTLIQPQPIFLCDKTFGTLLACSKQMSQCFSPTFSILRKQSTSFSSDIPTLL